jgi:trk system potassium uptake protein
VTDPVALAPLVEGRRPRWSSVTGWVVARALLACAGALGLATLVSLQDPGRPTVGLLGTGLAAGGLGALLRARSVLPTLLRTTAVHAAVCGAWLAMIAVGTVAYLSAGTFSDGGLGLGWGQLGDAAFESVAGFTTTALSVLRPIEGTPEGVLFWRASTQWIGGLGALLVVVAILPLLGVGGLEVTSRDPGTNRRALSPPRLRGALRRLGSAYVTLSVVGVLLFAVSGMRPFDATTYAMTTISTGGFSNHDGSFAFYASPAIDWFAAGGMALAGLNLVMVVSLLSGRPGPLLRSVELRAYAVILLATSAVVTLRTAPEGGPTLDSARNAVFAVTSAVSTTGHVSADWTLWDDGSQVLLLVLVGIGAMSGSAGGGFRITRALTLLGAARREVVRQLHPRSVVAVKVGRASVEDGMVSHLIGYQVSYLLLGGAGAVALAATGLELVTALSGAISALATMGPALGDLGPLSSVADQPPLARLLLCPLMLAGRLEIAPLLIGGAVLLTTPVRSLRAAGRSARR